MNRAGEAIGSPVRAAAWLRVKGEYATYRLVVRGELDERYRYLFEGMALACAEGTTVLTGSVRDQAKLHGLLERIEELGLELLAVEQIGPPLGGHPGRPAKRGGSEGGH